MFKGKLKTERKKLWICRIDAVRFQQHSSIRCEVRNHSAMAKNRLNGKLHKQSMRQDRLMRNGSYSKVVIMEGGEWPKFVVDILSFGPKHPVRDKYTEVQFLADVDKLVRELCKNKTEGEKHCKIEASAK